MTLALCANVCIYEQIAGLRKVGLQSNSGHSWAQHTPAQQNVFSKTLTMDLQNANPRSRIVLQNPGLNPAKQGWARQGLKCGKWADLRSDQKEPKTKERMMKSRQSP